MTEILSDRKIKDYIGLGIFGLNPFKPENVQPHSIDLTLAGTILAKVFDEKTAQWTWEERELPELITSAGFRPTPFALGSTVERIELPEHICAQVNGKSTLGRMGLTVHQTAGWIDAGFRGNITLELSSVSPEPVLLEEGMKIAQLVFFTCEPAEHPYGTRNNHYQNQRGATPPQGVQDLYD